MKNPWQEISLADYESHMKLDSVQQLQAMNAIMKGQFTDFPVKIAMVLGVAGGNGLEHIDKRKYRKVYGVDINREYLAECKKGIARLGIFWNVFGRICWRRIRFCRTQIC